MGYIKRDMEDLVQTLSSEYSCIMVTGPRQVGKSTMLEHIMPKNMNRVTLDDFQDRALAKKDPSLFLTLHPLPLFIDEVQYAPELFTYIKIAIDNGAPAGSFWLTGSKPFSLTSLAQETLAGRVALLHLPSLSAHEIYGSGQLMPFDLEINSLMDRQSHYAKANVCEVFKRIWNGSLPGFASGKFTNKDVFYSSYLQTYITRDLTEVTNENVDKFKFVDFIKATACRTSQELSVHAIALDVDISDDTAKRWLGILEKSDIIFYLHPYSNNNLKRVVKKPKLYFFDTGLVAYLTKYTTPEILQNGALSGAILENYVVNELRKNYLNLGQEPPIYYYRDKDANEIDIVLEVNGTLHAIEIKKSNNPSASLVSQFGVLKKASLPLGVSAIVCTKEELSAIDKDNLIIPIGLL